MDGELSSWKEIAAYLGVTVRTAQKWEHERGLPVRHLPGPRRGRVLTTVAELDSWKRSSSPEPELPPEPSPTRWPRFAGALLAVLVSTGAVYWITHPARLPARYHVQDSDLIISDDTGAELWKHSFPGLNTAAYTQEGLVWIGDLAGDGSRTVLFQESSMRPGSAESLVAFDSRGRERWRFTPGHAVRTARESFTPPFHPARFIVAPFGPRRETRIALASTHHLYYPTQIALLDRQGHLLREYWHSGHLTLLLPLDWRNQGRNVLLAGGISNARKTSTLVVLDPERFPGSSQEDDPAYQIQSPSTGGELARILFPRSCLNRTLEPFTTITSLWQNREGIHVEVQHRLSPADATVFYELDHSLELRAAGIGTAFERVHLAMQATHVIDHALSLREMDELKAVTRLGPQP